MRTKMIAAMLVSMTAACAAAHADADAAAGFASAAPAASPVPAVSAAPAVSPVPAASPAEAAPGLSGATAKQPIQRHKARMRWIEGPAGVPGSRMTVLEGNPREKGALFTIRLSIPKGRTLAPHTHPNDERVTVLEGSIHVGFGSKHDEAKGTRFEAGDYYVNPANTAHFVWTDEPATLQMTGIGPWEVVPVE